MISIKTKEEIRSRMKYDQYMSISSPSKIKLDANLSCKINFRLIFFLYISVFKSICIPYFDDLGIFKCFKNVQIDMISFIVNP